MIVKAKIQVMLGVMIKMKNMNRILLMMTVKRKAK